MINLSKSGDTIVFEFINNGHYLDNGTIEVPVNSLSLVMDSSNMCTFYKADSNDIFISATYDELGKTKAEMLEWFEENMVGGGGIDSGAVQTQIDQSISGFADSVLYNSTSKYVEFYNGGTGGTKVYEFDASDFVIDGMVDDVRIETISGVSYLVIDFNTASGKEDIQIPLTDIFDPSNYYTKTETNTLLGGKQDTLSAGTNITIVDNVISAEGGGKAVSGGTNISITTGETADTINCTIPFKYKNDSLLFGYNITLATGRYYSLGISPKDSNSLTQTKIDGEGAIAIGAGVTISGGTKNSGIYSTAIGYKANVYGVQSTALGVGCNASGNTTLAIGRNSASKGNDSIAIGNEAKVSGDSSVAIGRLAKVSGDSSVAIGSGATANGVDYKMNLNNQIKVTPSNQVYIYNKDNTEMICLQDQLEGGGKAVTGGTNISVTTGETADTINCTLPISAYNSNIYTTSSNPFGGNSFKSNNVVFGVSNIINKNSSGAFVTSNLVFGNGNKIGDGGYGLKDFNSNLIGGSNNKIYENNGVSDGCVLGSANEIKSSNEFAVGRFNVSSTASTTFGDSGNTLFSVGNGNATDARHNAFEIRQNGDIYITSGGTDIKLQDNLGSAIEVSSAITSGDTNPVQGGVLYDKFDEVEQVTAAALNNLSDNFDGLKLKKLTQAQYDALSGNTDSNTLYVIVN